MVKLWGNYQDQKGTLLSIIITKTDLSPLFSPMTKNYNNNAIKVIDHQ